MWMTKAVEVAATRVRCHLENVAEGSIEQNHCERQIDGGHCGQHKPCFNNAIHWWWSAAKGSQRWCDEAVESLGRRGHESFLKLVSSRACVNAQFEDPSHNVDGTASGMSD